MTVVRVGNEFDRRARIGLLVNGTRIDAYAGETLAVALLAAGYRTFRYSPRGHAPRGPFCMMGTCQECVVKVDGQLVQACLVPVRDGTKVTLG